MYVRGSKEDQSAVSLGELVRKLTHVDESLHHIHTEMISTGVYQAHREQHDIEIRRIHARLDKIDDDRTWIRRLMVGVLLTALGNLLVQGFIALTNMQ